MFRCSTEPLKTERKIKTAVRIGSTLLTKFRAPGYKSKLEANPIPIKNLSSDQCVANSVFLIDASAILKIVTIEKNV